MSRIFVSYRHEDSRGHAGRLYDRLVAEFGDEDVYRDVDKPRPGADIEERIRSELANCDAFVAVVGPAWASGDADNWARREIRMAVEGGVPIFVALVGNLGRDDLPGELAALSVPEVIALPEDYWAEGVARLIREVRGSLDAQVLAPHCREVAQSLEHGRLVAVLGPRWHGSSGFAFSPFGADESSLVELLAELPGILRRKGYNPALTVFTAGPHVALEAALRSADEEYEFVEDAYANELSLLRPSALDFGSPIDLAPPQAVTLARLPAPTLGHGLEPLTPEPASTVRSLVKPRLKTSLSIQLWHCNVLFLGVGKQDGVLASLANERAPIANDSAWWVVGVPEIAAHGWDEQGAVIVDAELPAYARALRRQVEALPPVE